jgi:hypothetical protein
MDALRRSVEGTGGKSTPSKMAGKPPGTEGAPAPKKRGKEGRLTPWSGANARCACLAVAKVNLTDMVRQPEGSQIWPNLADFLKALIKLFCNRHRNGLPSRPKEFRDCRALLS